MRSVLARSFLLAAWVLGGLGVDGSKARAQQTYPGGNGVVGFTVTTSTFANGQTRHQTMLRFIDPSTRAVTTFATFEGDLSDVEGAFSPNGQRFAYYKPTDRRIHVANLDGSADVAVTPAGPSGSVDQDLIWSPDGSKILFTRVWGQDNQRTFDLFVIRDVTRSTTPVRLTTDGYSAAATWANDSNTIAYSSLRDGDFEIYTQRADGSGLTQLTNNTVHDIYPAWAPNGSGIAYATGNQGQQRIALIPTINPLGLGWMYLPPMLISTTTTTWGAGISWSPDATKIAAGYGSLDSSAKLAVLSAPTLFTGWTELRTNVMVGFNLIWSPDGTRIACAPTNGGLFTIKPDGTGKDQLIPYSSAQRIWSVYGWQRR